MKDSDCVGFLQWSLPRLRMRWPGFRKVRRQVCNRVVRRTKELELADVAEYRSYLEDHPAEWRILDSFCRITISRFFRDTGVFEYLGRGVLPALQSLAATQGDKALRCWSAGCASGEEPYTLALLWRLGIPHRPHQPDLHIVATDTDPVLLDRARRACYASSSVKNVPAPWLVQAFEHSADGYCLKEPYREAVEFVQQDIRDAMPEGVFHLVLCRNLAFTYFEEALQKEMLAGVRKILCRGGALVIGVHESLPAGTAGFSPWAKKLGIYRAGIR